MSASSEMVFECKNPRCGHIFTVDPPDLGPPTGRIYFMHNGRPCPKCRREAVMMAGVFAKLPSGKTNYIFGPDETTKVIEQLRKIIEDAKNKENPDQLIADLEKLSPTFAIAARSILGRNGYLVLIIALTYLLAGCEAKIDMKLDWNIMADQLYHYATGKDPYPGLSNQADADDKKTDVTKKQQSEHAETKDLKPQPSHHKSAQSKRQKRRALRHCAPRRH